MSAGTVAPGADAFDAWIPARVASPDGAGSWMRYQGRVTLASSDMPVAFVLPTPCGGGVPYRHGDGRFWRPVRSPGDHPLSMVPVADMAALMSGIAWTPWPDDPFRPPGLHERRRLPFPPPSAWDDAAASVAGIAGAACAALRLVDGIVHRAVPEPHAVLELVPAGRRNRLSVSFDPWERPSSRRAAFPLDRFRDLQAALPGVSGLAPDAAGAIAAMAPDIRAPGIFSPSRDAVPSLGLPPNLDALPSQVREAWHAARALPEDGHDAWVYLAGEIVIGLADTERRDPAVAHGAYWAGLELALPLAATPGLPGSAGATALEARRAVQARDPGIVPSEPRERP